jgi:hypothetical protein
MVLLEQETTQIWVFSASNEARTWNVAHEPTALGPMRKVVDEPGHQSEEEEL